MLHPTSRRDFLLTAGAAGLAASCSPAAAPSSPSTQPSAPAPAPNEPWRKEWDDLVAAAKREGALALVTFESSSYRAGAEAFEQAFPGIRVDLTAISPSNFNTKLQGERQAGVYTYDISTNQFGVTGFRWVADGILSPVRPLLFRPDVLADASWRGGYDAGFLDKGKQFGFSSFWSKQRPIWINTDVVGPNEIRTVQDLLNPKWKGKMVAGDPRNLGGGKFVTVLRRATNDEFLGKLYKGQEMVLLRELRQLAESMFRGRYAIGIEAMNDSVIDEFFAQGLGKNLKPMEMEEINYILSSSGVLFHFSRGPHPNAAKLFANWVLTKEGATIWSKASGLNSRRTDVPSLFPDVEPLSGKKYLNLDYEEFSPELIKSQDIARAMLT
ncbi:MAG: extracellular solute-binding protein [Dehalococcoidia bacterium]|nr:extracellular solute-binding protein [Dehalococcoidia bacterium]